MPEVETTCSFAPTFEEAGNRARLASLLFYIEQNKVDLAELLRSRVWELQPAAEDLANADPLLLRAALTYAFCQFAPSVVDEAIAR